MRTYCERESDREHALPNTAGWLMPHEWAIRREVIAVVPRVDPRQFFAGPGSKDEPPPGYKEFYGWHNGIFCGLNGPCCTDRSLGGEDWTVYQGPVSNQ